ncbi:ubiquitin carboxyl-terminal hydrolase, partial [Helicosporidium sp. ATCC 50920]
PERLAASESWYCGRCQAHVRASKKLDLWSLPEVLVIHLKRFSYSRYARDKLATPVDFPLRGLDLREALLPQAPQRLAAERGLGQEEASAAEKKSGQEEASVVEQRSGPERGQGDASERNEASTLYDLYAVSDHFGGLGGGHYTATVQMQDDKKWYVFDDTQVRPVAEEDVASPAAYVLFYKRRSCDWAGAEAAFGRRRDDGDEPFVDGQARDGDALPDDDVMAVDLDI